MKRRTENVSYLGQFPFLGILFSGHIRLHDTWIRIRYGGQCYIFSSDHKTESGTTRIFDMRLLHSLL